MSAYILVLLIGVVLALAGTPVAQYGRWRCQAVSGMSALLVMLLALLFLRMF